eukprot:scaffold358_cov95-Skeletonema_dohrnii-CCMP3373.AAC.3
MYAPVVVGNNDNDVASFKELLQLFNRAAKPSAASEVIRNEWWTWRGDGRALEEQEEAAKVSRKL